MLSSTGSRRLYPYDFGGSILKIEDVNQSLATGEPETALLSCDFLEALCAVQPRKGRHPDHAEKFRPMALGSSAAALQRRPMHPPLSPFPIPR